MDASQIRATPIGGPTVDGQEYNVRFFLREIAAQLAEHVALQREIRDEQASLAEVMRGQMGIPAVGKSPHKRGT
jgi:hypothetical protein